VSRCHGVLLPLVCPGDTFSRRVRQLHVHGPRGHPPCGRTSSAPSTAPRVEHLAPGVICYIATLGVLPLSADRARIDESPCLPLFSSSFPFWTNAPPSRPRCPLTLCGHYHSLPLSHSQPLPYPLSLSHSPAPLLPLPFSLPLSPPPLPLPSLSHSHPLPSPCHVAGPGSRERVPEDDPGGTAAVHGECVAQISPGARDLAPAPSMLTRDPKLRPSEHLLQ